MDETASGTSGCGNGTSGAALRRRRLAWLGSGLLLFLVVQSVAIVESTLDDMHRLGVMETRGHVWTWQLSSVALWLALVPLLAWMVARVRPPRFSWPVTILLHLLATVPVSVMHVAGMVVLRKLAYAAGGERYDFGGLAEWLYEYRKDVATYLLAVGYLAYAQRLLVRPAPAAPRGEAVLQVIDGSVTHRVPIDAIDWAASAGNYVEIAWGSRTLLHRSTLAALAEQLGPAFVRIHRGRIVRAAAVVRVETDRSGDFTVALADGTALRGSRRFRGNLG
jgi:hypothetical protein